MYYISFSTQLRKSIKPSIQRKQIGERYLALGLEEFLISSISSALIYSKVSYVIQPLLAWWPWKWGEGQQEEMNFSTDGWISFSMYIAYFKTDYIERNSGSFSPSGGT